MTPNQAALSLANALETPGADFDALVAATELRRLVAENEALKKLPLWITYDAERDVLTIHGKRYSAGLFGEDGFCSPAGSVLRIEQGPDDVVTVTRLDAGD